ncbi:MAG: dephospho-CoA kinase [Candidatus Omnitrophota bacterium]
MLTVALTGGFQTGKTTVLSMFEKCGARVLSADWLVHRELERNVVLARQIKKAFGPHVFKNGKINRPLLAQHVFSDKKSLEKLNYLVHPYVKKEIISFFQKCHRRCRDSIVVVEVPLLFETGFEKFFDVTAVVFTKARITGERLAKHRVFTLKDMKTRNAHQFPYGRKMARCDYVIDNNASLKDTFYQVKDFMAFLGPLKGLGLVRIRE